MAYHLREFAWLWEHLPGTDGYPNLHMVQHLAETMRDYGPPSGLSCFAFERFNKVVGETNINNRAIERSFSLAWWRHDQLAMLPFVTGEWSLWSAEEKELYSEMEHHGTTLATEAQAAAGQARPSIAEQVACDRSRTAPVTVHETAVFVEEVSTHYAFQAELQRRRSEAKRQRRPRSSGLGLNPDRDSDDGGDDEKGAPLDMSGDSKRAPRPASLRPPAAPEPPPRVRLTGAEPFIGRLVLPTPVSELEGEAKKRKQREHKKLQQHELNLEGPVGRGKGKKPIPSDVGLLKELVAYFGRIYDCAHKNDDGSVVPLPRRAPRPPDDADKDVWTASVRAARAAAVPTEGKFAHFSLSLICPRSHRLQFFNQDIGTASSRLKRSSWVMVLSGTRVCPAQCLLFVEPTITLTMADGTVLPPRTHRLVQLRCVVDERE